MKVHHRRESACVRDDGSDKLKWPLQYLCCRGCVCTPKATVGRRVFHLSWSVHEGMRYAGSTVSKIFGESTQNIHLFEHLDLIHLHSVRL